jgi:hypothetical protein
MDRMNRIKEEEESNRALNLKFKISNHFAKRCFYPAYPVYPV